MRKLADRVGISSVELEPDLKGVFNKIQKRRLTSMAREAKRKENRIGGRQGRVRKERSKQEGKRGRNS